MSIYKDNTGQIISISVNEETTPISAVLKVLKPDLTEEEWAITYYAGYWSHALASGDVDQAGTYKCQIAFEFAGGIELLSDTFTFEVKERWT